MSRLALYLLGPPRVERDGEAVRIHRRRAVALLAYLAMTKRWHSRDALATLLWPEHDQRSARAGLRRALSTLRKALGEDWLDADGELVGLNPEAGLWLDAEEFQARLTECRGHGHGAQQVCPDCLSLLAEAALLYQDDFLAGFTLPDSPSFDDWQFFQTERLRDDLGAALERLAMGHGERGEYEAAVAHGRRWVALDPLNEPAHRTLIRLYAWSGQRGAALAQYETCRRVLVEELGIEPGAETTQLYEQIRDGELDISPVAPTLIREPELVAWLPGFLAEETEEVQPPVFVTRERELARLEGFLGEALTGDGKVVFVTGGPGRGKTALLDEFARRAMEVQPDLLVASGHCNAYSGIGDPYLPFRDVMGMLTGDVEAKWAAGAIARDHALRLWDALPLAVQALVDHGPHVVPALVPGAALLSRATAVAPTGAPWLQRLRERVERRPAGSEGLEQSHLFQQVTNLLRALAEAYPLLLILDDMQWADSASIGLLFHLCRRLEGSRILIAGAYRPEEIALGRDGTGSEERARSGHPLARVLAELKRRFGDVWVNLADVQEPEGRRFVDAFLDLEPNRLGEGFRRELFEHAGGHPLFTVELLRAMQERGDLVQDGTGCWVLGSALDWETLPPRVEGVIEARIGRLEEKLRAFLSVASVEGEEFTAQVVAQVQEASERQALRRLSQDLEKRHRLVREQSLLLVGRQRVTRYRFAHALFRQYLYDKLGEGERALLHRQIARVLEKLYDGHIEEVVVRLAHHYSEARDETRALEYFTLAGDVALASYANQEAEGYYRRALELATAESERARLLSGLGEALFRRSRFQEAIRTWHEGIELYRVLEDSDGVARLYARSASAANQAYDPTESLRLCLEGLAIVKGAAESSGLARLLHMTAATYRTMALLEEGRPFVQQALEMAERLGDVEMQVLALIYLGASLLTGESALETLARAVELAESNGLLFVASETHNSLGYATMIYRGDYRAGREHYQRGAELAGQAGRTTVQIYTLSNSTFYALRYGEFEEAETMLSQIRALVEELTEPTYAAERAPYSEMWYQGLSGEWEASIWQARARQASAHERGADHMLAWAKHWLAWVTLESRRLGDDAQVGEWEEAETAMVEAVEIYDRSSMPMYAVETRVWLGSLRVTQGRLGDARRLLAEAREKATVQPVVFDEPHLLLLEAQLASAEGRWAEALAAFEAAVRILDRLGMRWYRARWLLDWAEAHVARGQAADIERARDLLLDAQTAFEEMGVPRYAAVAQNRLQALRAMEEPANWQTQEP